MDGYTSADARAEVEQRKHELDAYNDTKAASPPKKKNKTNLPVPTENHMKLRANVEAGDKWEHDLKEIHGLSDEEISMVNGIVMKHYKDARFPDYDPDATRGIDFYRALAKPGWRVMQKTQKLCDQYPRENAEQTRIKGVWYMLNSFEDS